MGEKKDPGALQRAFERSTKSISDGSRQSLPRKEVTFVVDHTVCAAGVFDEDFELTLRSLTSQDELAAARACKGDVTVMAMLMARNSLHALNGAMLDRGLGQDEWLWNVLDAGGRQLVVMMFANVGAPGEAALGKALASVTMG